MRERRSSLASCGSALMLLMGFAGTADSQTGMLREGQAPPPPEKAKEFAVSAADEPRPALKYRFMPLSSTLTPGNAAPIYLRSRHEFTNGYEQVQRRPAEWLDQPFDTFEAAEARSFVDQFSGRLKLFEFGARREFCDWNYTLPEQRLDAIEILLPDAQEMRTWARLLHLKARVEIKEGKYDEAIRTLETSFAFARHVGRSPFIIGNLIGIAIQMQTLARVEELLAQPDAPNLYWALTSLPRPLIDMREAVETEYRLAENMVPELAEIDSPHTPAGWTALLEGMHAHMKRFADKLREGNDEESPALKALKASTLDDIRKQFRLKARIHAATRRKLTGEQARALPEDETIALYLADQHRVLRDTFFRSYYVPFAESRGLREDAAKVLEEAKAGPLAALAEWYPSLYAAHGASVRAERQAAALRVVEALRLHAARNGGKLPASLAEIRELPIPEDPATHRPFTYRLDGDAGVLTADLIENQPKSGVHHRVTIRK